MRQNAGVDKHTELALVGLLVGCKTELLDKKHRRILVSNATTETTLLFLGWRTDDNVGANNTQVHTRTQCERNFCSLILPPEKDRAKWKFDF